MSLTSRQRLLLAILIVVVLAGSWRWLGPLVLDLAASTGVSPSRADLEAIALADVETVRLSDLEVAPRDYSPGRNIFRIGRRAPPPPPPAPPPPVAAPVQTAPPPPAVAPKPQPPPVDVTLLGIFGPDRRRIAVLKDKKGEGLYNVLEQDVVNKKFVVAEIGLQSVALGFVGFPDAEPARLKIGG